MHSVPRFFLYGEADRDVETRFIHVETVAARSRLHDWAIRPHRHSHLYQLLLIVAGASRLSCDGTEHELKAPALVGVPRGFVHGFEFTPETQGWVISMSDSYAGEIVARNPDLAALRILLEPSILNLTRQSLSAHRLEQRCREIEHEFRWSALGRITAITANLQLLFLALGRLRHERSNVTTSEDAALFARFRALVEAWYREHRPLSAYVAELGVPEKRLGAACRAAVNRTPLEVIHERLTIEAKRTLLYTALSVSETAYSLGFQDPAYFSRFFSKQAGCSPRKFARGRPAAN